MSVMVMVPPRLSTCTPESAGTVKRTPKDSCSSALRSLMISTWKVWVSPSVPAKFNSRLVTARKSTPACAEPSTVEARAVNPPGAKPLSRTTTVTRPAFSSTVWLPMVSSGTASSSSIRKKPEDTVNPAAEPATAIRSSDSVSVSLVITKVNVPAAD